MTNLKRCVAGFFLILFTAYYANVTLFEHCHVINGVTIVHSHFHTESHHTTPSGGHSESSLTLIAALSTIQCVAAAAVLCCVAACRVVVGQVGEICPPKPVSPRIPYHSLRAPPALQ